MTFREPNIFKDRIEFDKCFICGIELNLSLENNLSYHNENWRTVYHNKYGNVKIHIKHYLSI